MITTLDTPTADAVEAYLTAAYDAAHPVEATPDTVTLPEVLLALLPCVGIMVMGWWLG